MKQTYLLFVASAAMMLAGCTQNEVLETVAPHAIGFSTYVGSASRTTVTNNVDVSTVEFLKGDGGGVYIIGSYETLNEDDELVTVPVFENTPLTYKNGSWGYSPIQYWLDDKLYNFVAYGPASVLNNGVATMEITNPTSATDRENHLIIANFVSRGKEDLVVAEGKTVGYRIASAERGEAVNFKFFHALSKIRFTFVNGWVNNVFVNINNVSFKNVKCKGSLRTSGQLFNVTNNITNSVIWTGATDVTDYTLYKGTRTGAIDPETGYLENGVMDGGCNGHRFAATGDEFVCDVFCIPQAALSEGMVLEFYTQVTNGQGGGPNLGNGAGQTKKVQVNIPVDVVTQWVAGYAYNYKLTLDGDMFGLKPIHFDVTSVYGWQSGNEDDIHDEGKDGADTHQNI